MAVKKMLAVNLLILLILILNGIVFTPSFPESFYIYTLDNQMMTNDYDAVRKIKEEQFLLAYYSKAYGNMEAGMRSVSGNIFGVNSFYQQANKILLKEGSFITEAHEANRDRVAVLNLYAAFSLFGTSENIVGETIIYGGNTYFVIGVVNDGEKDEVQIYIPVTVLDQGIKEMIIPLNEVISKALVQNALESQSINVGNILLSSHYTDLPPSIALFFTYIFLIGVLIYIFAVVLFKIFEEAKKLYQISRQIHFQSWFIYSESRKQIFKIVCTAIVFILPLLAVIGAIMERAVIIYLTYYPMFSNLLADNFNINNYKFQDYATRTMYSSVLSVLFLSSFIYLGYIIWRYYKINSFDFKLFFQKWRVRK